MRMVVNGIRARRLRCSVALAVGLLCVPVVVFADDDIHSPFLIRTSEIVINFGSSIGFEALRQKKLVINPTYLHDNRTFFDGSKAVYDVANEAGVVKFCSCIM